MSDFLNDKDREEIEACIDYVHDEFAKDIMIYNDSKMKTAVVETSFNKFYNRNGSGDRTSTREIQKIAGKGRILHGDPRLDLWADPSVKSQLRIKIPTGGARLRVDKATYDILKEAKRVTIIEEDVRYTISSHFRPHGVFNNRYYDLYLHIVEEED